MDCSTLDIKNQEHQLEEKRDESTIFEAFEKVHDGRKARGKRYPFAFLLTLLSLGKMAGERTITGIVEWIKERESSLKNSSIGQNGFLSLQHSHTHLRIVMHMKESKR